MNSTCRICQEPLSHSTLRPVVTSIGIIHFECYESVVEETTHLTDHHVKLSKEARRFIKRTRERHERVK